jgi:plastocyanin
MANSWSIKIVKGDPCTFEPDVYCPPGQPKPQQLQVDVQDLISWNNLTSEPHEIYTKTETGPTPLTDLIQPDESSNGYAPQTAGTIEYYCNLHDGEIGTIEVLS